MTDSTTPAPTAAADSSSDARRLRQPLGRAGHDARGRSRRRCATMLKERHAENESFSPARVLNMVCIVDKAWSGEVANRLRNVGRYHASRTVVLAFDPRREKLDAVATIASDVHPKAGEFALLRETVIVDVGDKHVPALDTIVDPLRGHRPADAAVVAPRPPRGDRQLLGLAQVVLLDSVDEPDLHDALGARAGALAQGLRRRPRLAALDALARARRRDVRPRPAAARPRRHQLGDHPPPPRLDGGGAAAHRLAGLAAGLGAVAAHRPQRLAGRQGARRAARTSTCAWSPSRARACAASPA